MNIVYTETYTTRTVQITYRSYVNDAAWQEALAEIEEVVEQIACDYAASSNRDFYEVTVTEEF